MKTLLPTLCCLLILNTSIAQSSVKGRILDNSQQPLAFANVLLLRAADSTLVRGLITEDDGEYQFDLESQERYLISSSIIGYTTIYSQVFVGNGKSIELPAMVLAEAVNELEEVTVVARKPLFEQQIDRTVINVQNSITSAGNSALEVLEKSPGVEVDRGNEVLSMFGKQGVIVMINGKRNRMDMASIIQLLNGIPASNIEKIELITTPPANFDAEGDAGIINIVLVNNLEEGFNGNYSLNVGYGLRPKFGGSLNFNWRKKKVNFYGVFSSNYDFFQQNTDFSRSILFEGVETITNGESDRPGYRGVNDGRLGLDIELSDKTTLGFLIAGYTNLWDLDASTFTSFKNGTSDQYSQLSSLETNHWIHGMANVSLQHQFAEGESLTFDFDYLYYHDDNPTDYVDAAVTASGEPLAETEFLSRKETPIHFQVAKIDYNKKVSDKFSFSVGLKGTNSDLINDVRVEDLVNDTWVVNQLLTARFDLTERIGAAYVSTTLELSPKTSMKAGLRYEYTETNLGTETEKDIVDRQFGRLFPSFFFAHNINDNNRVQFSFGQRISRPSYDIIAPAFFFFGPNTILAGNPAIQNNITYNIRGEYRYKTILMSAQYSIDEAPIIFGQPLIDPALNQVILRAENMKDAKVLNLSLSFPINFTPWWESQYNASAFYFDQRPIVNGEVFDESSDYYSLYTSQNFKLPKDFAAEISWNFNSGLQYGLAQIPVRWMLNFGFQKSFNGGATKLSLNCNDIFNTGSFFETTYDEPDLNLNTNWAYFLEAPMWRLTFSQRFGKETVKARRERSTGSEEERQRVGG